MFRILLLCLTLFISACDSDVTYNIPPEPQSEGVGSVDMNDQELGLCSSSPDGSTLVCTGGQTIALPPAFPSSKDCNQCISKVENGVVKVKCPNGLNFEFVSVKGDKGDMGSSCSVTADGWVKCTDGTSYKLLQGPKGETGKDGIAGKDGKNGTDGKDGIGCTLGTNTYGQTTITCGDKTTVIDDGCFGGCWDFGLKGNVYDLPTNTQSLPDFSALTPVATVEVDDLSVFSQASNLGYPGTFTPAFTKTTWYGIVYTGYIELPACKDDKCIFKLTSDDGARFRLSSCDILIIDNDGLHPPQSKTGIAWALPGWHSFKLEYFQGPAILIALGLEVSTDGGITFRLVAPDEYKFKVD